MKILSLAVEHFRCVRKATLEFGPGLNVLHGPNDLGKSSLAAAIRAALLLQANSREHEEFVNWENSGVPHVELTFESEAQRIWRVRKTFGSSGQTYLDESRNGVDFQPGAKGRDVEGRLSEILRWGLAPPGSKGRPKGMPMTFLSTALLAEQDRVSAIFDQALSKDSDESGKKRLIEALKAVAEDPIYKTVLAHVQAQFDRAFTANGGKRRGKDSPWMQIADEIRQKEEQDRQCREQLQKTAAIEIELQGLHRHQMDRRSAVDSAQSILEQMEAWYQAGKLREEVLGRLREANARQASIAATLADLAQAEERRRALAREAEALAAKAEAARVQAAEAAKLAQAAHDEAARLQGADVARERLLKRTALEKRMAELQSEQAAALALQSAAARVRTIESEAGGLASSAQELEQRHRSASQSVAQAEERASGLRAIGQLIRYRTARDAWEKAEAGFLQVNGWREEATRKRSAAALLEAAAGAVSLPSAALLADFRQLEHQLQLARARLEVGLNVRIVPKRGLRIALRRDGAETPSQEIKEALETSAAGEIRLDIDKVAEITISGGGKTARDEVQRLQKRWLAEVEPALERANAVNLEHLGRLVADAAARLQQIDDARRAASQLEQRIADQPDWAGQRTDRQAELTAAEAALGKADRTALEASMRQLRIADLAAVESRLEALRVEQAKLVDVERKFDAERAGLNARIAENQKALAAAREALNGDWKQLLPQAEARLAAIQKEVVRTEKELANLASETDQTVTTAKKLLETAEKGRAAAEAAGVKAAEELRGAERRLATADGEIQMRREAASQLDSAAAQAAVRQVEAELAQTPAPPQPVTAELLAEARAAVEAARAELRSIEDEIQAKRGALQHVGGEVARQRAEAAAEALKAARGREQVIETDYAAWELLRTTLLDVEREEEVHLGRQLGDPIAKRFAELTERRYGPLTLGPDLETGTISVAGGGRAVDALSVGTRDQLSTIFRLTLAEQLQSAVMLDDQLTQSDDARMMWLRELIRQLAGSIQILVFTCRPSDYLTPSEMKPTKKSEAVRSLNLLHLIESTRR